MSSSLAAGTVWLTSDLCSSDAAGPDAESHHPAALQPLLTVSHSSSSRILIRFQADLDSVIIGPDPGPDPVLLFVPPRFQPQLADTRKEFVRIGEDLEMAAAKNAQVSRHKAADAERASHLLLATRKCYQHFALDYCLQVVGSGPEGGTELTFRFFKLWF